MANQKVIHNAPSGGTYYAHPADLELYSLANWATNRVQLNERAAPNVGQYANEVDDSKGMVWLIFESATQPASADEAVASVALEAEVARQQTTPEKLKEGVRLGLEGRWTDEDNESFDLTVEDI